tara:strand:+ start:236 stop:784 length:549 start_codon:yes stop_codon:yes gene_type:complete
VHGMSGFYNNEFLFDKNITKELPSVVFHHNDGRPSLVFCSTRKKCEEAAQLMHERASITRTAFPQPGGNRRSASSGGARSGTNGSGQSSFISNSVHIVDRQHMERLKQLSSQLTHPVLRTQVQSGTAFHHAELTHQDRELIEKSFRSGDLFVMCCTSTMSMGVNLPAHLVVVLNVKRYAGKV